MFPHFPFSNFHELNLDWILEEINKLKEALSRVDPSVVFSKQNLPEISDVKNLPTILAEKYSAENEPPYPVSSVNNKTGNVVIKKDDIEGLVNDLSRKYSPDNTPPYPMTSFNTRQGAVTLNDEDVKSLKISTTLEIDGDDDPTSWDSDTLKEVYDDGIRFAVGAWLPAINGYTKVWAFTHAEDEYSCYLISVYSGSAAGVVNSVNNKVGIVVLNIEDIPQLQTTLNSKYSASNPPTFPVNSVNGMTGTVNVQGMHVSLDITETGVSASQAFVINGITDDMRVYNSIISNPSAQKSTWNVETAENQITVSGYIDKPCTLELILFKTAEGSVS